MAIGQDHWTPQRSARFEPHLAQREAQGCNAAAEFLHRYRVCSTLEKKWQAVNAWLARAASVPVLDGVTGAERPVADLQRRIMAWRHEERV
jgi:hypothetical protein